MPPQAPFDEQLAHKWFAIQLNNQAWDLLEKRDLNAVEQEQVVHMAHASCYHWMKVGDIVNHARALCLVANAEAAYGDAGAALMYSQSCIDAVYAKSMYRDSKVPEDWDIAFAHDAHGRANAANWRHEMMRTAPEQTLAAQLYQEANNHRMQALELGQAIVDPESKQLFLNWFQMGDWHGII